MLDGQHGPVQKMVIQCAAARTHLPHGVCTCYGHTVMTVINYVNRNHMSEFLGAEWYRRALQ